ncbi:MAG: DUF5069 domain-containing protein [Candidatus Eremiobacteraeota bacterium]|nr:DUF5069 domain-containing protein [Candidatus Eremiobacteraeota bacterium]
MDVRDLSQMAPRRWNEEIGGIKWLPRLIDKTRAANAGTLGLYLYGQSPVDRSLLRALGLRYSEFTKIVGNALGDDDVFREIALKTPDGIERARMWSSALPRRLGLFLLVLDLDDGYLQGPFWSVLRWPTTIAANAVSAAAKRLWPSRGTRKLDA